MVVVATIIANTAIIVVVMNFVFILVLYTLFKEDEKIKVTYLGSTHAAGGGSHVTWELPSTPLAVMHVVMCTIFSIIIGIVIRVLGLLGISFICVFL